MLEHELRTLHFNTDAIAMLPKIYTPIHLDIM